MNAPPTATINPPLTSQDRFRCRCGTLKRSPCTSEEAKPVPNREAIIMELPTANKMHEKVKAIKRRTVDRHVFGDVVLRTLHLRRISRHGVFPCQRTTRPFHGRLAPPVSLKDESRWVCSAVPDGQTLRSLACRPRRWTVTAQHAFRRPLGRRAISHPNQSPP